MNTVIINSSSNFSGTNNPFATGETYYIIQGNVDINNTTYEKEIGNYSILHFEEGASLDNGNLKMQNTKIEGEGYIFKSGIGFIAGGSMLMDEIKAEWFGALPDLNYSVHTHIQKAIDACCCTYVRRLRFLNGVYKIQGIINIGSDTLTNDSANRSFWDFEIVGAGKDETNGTTFQISAFDENTKVAFSVHQKNPNMGARRGGSICNCRFVGPANSDNYTAIEINYAHTYTIYNCAFVNLNVGISLMGECYYVGIRSCDISNCPTGIKNKEDTGLGFPNNNIVKDCIFSNCGTSPIDLSGGGQQWHIYDINVNTGCGPIKVGDNHLLENVQISNALQNQTWLEVGSFCDVKAKFTSTSENTTVKPWRCVVNGNGNNMELEFEGLNQYAMISYGTGNTFDVTASSGTYDRIMQFVFDPEDTFKLNDYSNKEDYIGTNLITDVTCLTNSSGTEVPCDGGKCLPMSSDGGITMYMLPAEYYKTCLFYVKDSTPGTTRYIGLMNGFNMKTCDKWMCYVGAYKRTGAVGQGRTRRTLATYSSQYQMYVRDVVVSAIPLYRRPVLYYMETDTLNQYQNDGVIHLQQTYINFVRDNFCFIPDRPQMFVNNIGKYFFRSTSFKYICNGNQIVISDYNDGKPIVSNDGCLPWVIRDMLNVDVELYEKFGSRLFLQARRSSSSAYFTITITLTDGMTYKANNPYGSLEIYEHGFTITPWVKKA